MNPDLLQHLAERTPGIVVTRLGIERQIIPYPDSIKMLSMHNSDGVVEEGKWVRVRKGRYKGDVGLIVAVKFWGAEVLLVPRLKSRLTHSTPNSLKRKRTTDIPQPGLFNPEDANNIPCPRRLDNGHYTLIIPIWSKFSNMDLFANELISIQSCLLLLACLLDCSSCSS
jgi:hypothetical protein